MITYPYKTKSVALPGDCNITYIDEGKGKQTLLFIHGLANYAPVWKKNIDVLKSDYRCIAIDLPGNGLSGKEDRNYNMMLYAQSVYEFIQALGLENLTLVGHSMGGQVAMITTIAYPHCARNMVLCAPAGFEEFSQMDKTLYSGALSMADFISSNEFFLRKIIH